MMKTSLWSSIVNWSNSSRTRYCRSLLMCLGNSLCASWCYWTGARCCRPSLRRLYPITLMEAAVCIENNTARRIGILHAITRLLLCCLFYSLQVVFCDIIYSMCNKIKYPILLHVKRKGYSRILHFLIRADVIELCSVE